LIFVNVLLFLEHRRRWGKGVTCQLQDLTGQMDLAQATTLDALCCVG